MKQESNENESLNVIDGALLNTAGTHYVITGGDLDPSTITTSTFTIPYERKLEKVEFIKNDEGNFMEITYSETPIYHLTYTVTWTIPGPGKRMVKERYGVVNGKMELIKTIQGVEQPGYYVDPTIEWEE